MLLKEVRIEGTEIEQSNLKSQRRHKAGKKVFKKKKTSKIWSLKILLKFVGPKSSSFWSCFL